MTDSATDQSSILRSAPAALDWVDCDNWDDLPEGQWIVKLVVGRSTREYQVATVKTNTRNSRFVIVGHGFSFDAGQIEAYAAFIPYKSSTKKE